MILNAFRSKPNLEFNAAKPNDLKKDDELHLRFAKISYNLVWPSRTT